MPKDHEEIFVERRRETSDADAELWFAAQSPQERTRLERLAEETAARNRAAGELPVDATLWKRCAPAVALTYLRIKPTAICRGRLTEGDAATIERLLVGDPPTRSTFEWLNEKLGELAALHLADEKLKSLQLGLL